VAGIRLVESTAVAADTVEDIAADAVDDSTGRRLEAGLTAVEHTVGQSG